MKKFINKEGFKIIELSLSEVRLVGGYGLCDTCNGFAENGFLIPVLGTYWMCPKCYEEWNKHSKLEEEDKEYEEQNYQRWLEILKENGVKDEQGA